MDKELVQAAGFERPQPEQTGAQAAFEELLAQADVRLNGPRPWDLQIRHGGTFERVLGQGCVF